MRVLVVDDSAFMRKVISQILSSDPAIEVVGTARDGQEGVDLAKALRPDLITLDVEMPVMDGLTALKKIRTECRDPRPAVLMCSTLTSAGSHEALRAMRLGAADVIAIDANPPAGTLASLQADLLGKVHAIVDQRTRASASRPSAPSVVRRPERSFRLDPRTIDLVLIGASTGGPPVLEKILTRLPADLRAPIIIAQHMPATFTKSLAERLDQTCAVSVVHGDREMPLHPGTVYITKGGRHGRVVRRGAARLAFEASEQPDDALYKPSINELFWSAARAGLRTCLGVVLTGMGDDGAKGAKDFKALGNVMLAQDAGSCVVYGMPRAIAEGGLADASMTPDEITAVLSELSHGAAARGPAAAKRSTDRAA